MTWTSDPPTVEGKYWSRPIGTTGGVLEYIYERYDGDLMVKDGDQYQNMDCTLSFYLKSHPDHEFYGPLEVPE